MKKTLLILVILALLVPATAMAQTEFTLGGFVKLDSFWDSTQENKNMTGPIARNNDRNFQHGRMKFTAQGSRFNLTIKGPKLWGASTTGFFEIDFDAAGDQVLGASNQFTPRLRHAMFRMNWPETELLMGQYWSFMCEYNPESAQDGGLQNHGAPTHRLAQIRLTQKFLNCFTAGVLVGEPTSVGGRDTTNPNFSGLAIPTNLPGNVLRNHTLNANGESAESPHVQAKFAYEADLWGKAPFFGRPRGFVAQINGGWQRTEARNGDNNQFAVGNAVTWDQNNFSAAFNLRQSRHQYLDNWMLQGILFIPVIPTYSANLAGTASLTANYYVGQGLEAFGESTGASNLFFKFSGLGADNGGVIRPFWALQTQKRYGGFVQGQYYFTNQWFLNAAWGFSKAFGVTQSRDFLAALAGVPNGNTFATLNDGVLANVLNDPVKFWQEFDLTLWYRPIQAIKFGLQYSYGKTEFFQKRSAQAANPFFLDAKDFGEAHRIEFVGFLYF